MRLFLLSSSLIRSDYQAFIKRKFTFSNRLPSSWVKRVWSFSQAMDHQFSPSSRRLGVCPSSVFLRSSLSSLPAENRFNFLKIKNYFTFLGDFSLPDSLSDESDRWRRFRWFSISFLRSFFVTRNFFSSMKNSIWTHMVSCHLQFGLPCYQSPSAGQLSCHLRLFSL